MTVDWAHEWTQKTGINKHQKTAQILVTLGCLVVLVGSGLHLGGGYPTVSAALAKSNLNDGIKNALRAVFLMIGITWIVVALVTLLANFAITRISKPLTLLCGLAPLVQVLIWVNLMGWFIGNEMFLLGASLAKIAASGFGLPRGCTLRTSRFARSRHVMTTIPSPFAIPRSAAANAGASSSNMTRRSMDGTGGTRKDECSVRRLRNEVAVGMCLRKRYFWPRRKGFSDAAPSERSRPRGRRYASDGGQLSYRKGYRGGCLMFALGRLNCAEVSDLTPDN